MSEASEKKAHEYLTTGKVRVLEHDDSSALITVQGSAKEPYNVIFGNATWHCSCPARKPLCAHVIAAKLISPLRKEAKGLNPDKDPEIDAVLGDLHAEKEAAQKPQASNVNDLDFLLDF